jgi:hypothetical protein
VRARDVGVRAHVCGTMIACRASRSVRAVVAARQMLVYPVRVGGGMPCARSTGRPLTCVAADNGTGVWCTGRHGAVPLQLNFRRFVAEQSK